MGRWATPRALVIGAVALAAVVLAGAAVRLIDRPAASERVSLAPVPAHTPAASPPGQGATPTPFAAAPTDTPTPTPSPTPSPTPRATPTMTPITVAVQESGRTVTVSAVTAPRTACTITVGYSPPPHLGAAISSGSGAVRWTWTVITQVRPGIYPIQVTCGTGAAGATITVT